MATDLPRFHHQLAPNSMQYERNFDNVSATRFSGQDVDPPRVALRRSFDALWYCFPGADVNCFQT